MSEGCETSLGVRSSALLSVHASCLRVSARTCSNLVSLLSLYGTLASPPLSALMTLPSTNRLLLIFADSIMRFEEAVLPL